MHLKLKLNLGRRRRNFVQRSVKISRPAGLNTILRYIDDTLSVMVDSDGSGDFRKVCFSQSGVKLPTGLYVGLTSATGDLTDNHDVQSFKIWQLDGTDAGTRHEMKPEVLNLKPREVEGTY